MGGWDAVLLAALREDALYKVRVCAWVWVSIAYGSKELHFLYPI